MVAEKTPRKKDGCMDWEKIYAGGEMRGRSGFRSETANGTAGWAGTGYNRIDYQFPMPEAAEGGAWQGGRNNRTGE